MTLHQPSASFRLAEWCLQKVLGFWPRESRDWGRALAAELYQIHSSREALSWSFGGMLLFSRAIGTRLLAWARLPVGATVENAPAPGGKTPPRLPNHSRLLTAALVALTICGLLLPWGREAFSGVYTTCRIFTELTPDTSLVEKLAKNAEKESDARKLAFAALGHPDPARGAQLASEAVAMDPSLSWIYVSRFRRGDSFSTTVPDDWTVKFIANDPDNAFVYLLAAEQSRMAEVHNLVQTHSPTPEEFEKLLGNDPHWRELMDRAVHAPRYDSYAGNHARLCREIWRREKSLSPTLVMYSMWASILPDALNLKTYVKLRVHETQVIAAEGATWKAQRELSELNAFGERMAMKEQTDFERMLGMEVSHESLTGLRDVYRANHNQKEVEVVTQQLDRIAAVRSGQMRSFREVYDPYFAHFRTKAFLVFGALLLMLFAGCAFASGFLFLELSSAPSRKTQKFLRSCACRAADYAPFALLCGVAAFILSYRPFAAAFEQYRMASGPSADPRFLTAALAALGDVLLPKSMVNSSYYFWLASTPLLTLVALSLVVHLVIRRKTAH